MAGSDRPLAAKIEGDVRGQCDNAIEPVTKKLNGFFGELGDGSP